MQLLHVEGVGEEVMLLILGLLVFIALVIYLCIKQSGYTHGAEQPPVCSLNCVQVRTPHDHIVGSSN